MILQKLHNDYGISMEPVLIREYKRLNLTTQELNVLLVLLNNPSKKRVFSLNAITKRLDYSSDDVANIVNNLIEKEFLTLTLDQTTSRAREIYCLSNVFNKLTELFIEDEKIKLIEKHKTDIAETIELLEAKLNRLLRPNELDRVRLWYEQYNFDHLKVINAINAVTKNINVLYIEKLLLSNIEEAKPLDDQTSALLDKIYKGL